MPNSTKAPDSRPRSALAVAAAVAMLMAACTGDPAIDAGSPGVSPEGRDGGAQPVLAPVVVGDSAVGCLRIGASRASVERACGVVRDTTIHLEGMPQAALWVDVGPGEAIAEIHNGEVWRIRVTDPALSTRDAIGVGTRLNSLAEHPGIRIAWGEGLFAGVDAHCGLSFGLSDPGGALPFRRDWTADQIRAVPDDVTVDLILVVGRCPEGEHPHR